MRMVQNTLPKTTGNVANPPIKLRKPRALYNETDNGSPILLLKKTSVQIVQFKPQANSWEILYLGNLHTEISVHTRALYTQQDSQVQGRPIRVLSATISAFSIARYSLQYIQWPFLLLLTIIFCAPPRHEVPTRATSWRFRVFNAVALGWCCTQCTRFTACPLVASTWTSKWPLA